jgi:hypothetical protein
MATVDITYYGAVDPITRMLPKELISRATLTVGTDIRTQNPTNAAVAYITANGADAIVAFGDVTVVAGAANSQLIKSGMTYQRGTTPGNYIAVAAG